MKTLALLLICLSACMVGDGSAPDEVGVPGSALSGSDTGGSGGVGMLARTCAAGATTPGVDVSYYQGTIDWSQVAAAGEKFAFIRVSYGTTFHDPKFDSYWAGAKNAGLLRGAYQFFLPDQSATAQANIMIAAVGQLGPGDLPPVLDLEDARGLSPSQVAAATRTWVDAVKAGTGVTPIIYTGKYFWRDQVGGPASFVGNPLWIAQYTSLCPDLPAPWGSWAFWQYSESGHVAGMHTNTVDLDRFNGSLADLQALAGLAGTGSGDGSGSGAGSGSGSGGGAGSGSGSGSGSGAGTPTTCTSQTLGRDVDDGVCVQAVADAQWYQCSGGAWTSIADTSSCTATYAWCSSATLGRNVPPRTCVQSASDQQWYQCDGSGWAQPVDTDAETGPAGNCAGWYPY